MMLSSEKCHDGKVFNAVNQSLVEGISIGASICGENDREMSDLTRLLNNLKAPGNITRLKRL